jgi:hypothetical protein
MLHANFVELDEKDQLQIIGGGFLIIAALCIIGGIIANEATEKITGNDIPTHLGGAIKHVGVQIQSLSEKLIN